MDALFSMNNIYKIQKTIGLKIFQHLETYVICHHRLLSTAHCSLFPPLQDEFRLH